MADRIKLVQGDTLPWITITLESKVGDDQWVTLNVSDATVRLKFRAAGTTTVLSTIVCQYVTNGADGKVKHNFPAPTLNVEPGLYEGEIEVDFGGGDVQTVYDVQKYVVRKQF